jgi:hypothetical protein
MLTTPGHERPVRHAPHQREQAVSLEGEGKIGENQAL